MDIEFTKMHGLGNDFVVIDASVHRLNLTREQIRFIADRHLGVGCDQLLLVEASQDPTIDFTYRIFNADGGEVGQCGNGARCFARFVRDQHLSDKNELRVQTLSGVITLHTEADGQITVNMGIPQFAPAAIPFEAEHRANSYTLALGDEQIEIGAVSLGNPHAVVRVEDVEQTPVARLGPLIESHTRFPQRVNAGFMQLLDRQHIRLRVYERGSAETLACGSGACAAMAVGRQRGWLDDKVTVSLRGGDLQVCWQGEGQAVMMTGPVASVFEGRLKL